MPDFSISLPMRAAAPGARIAVLGAAAPIRTRPLTVQLAPMPIGASGPMHAPGAGMPLLGQAEFQASPGGAPIAFPPGIEREAFYRTVPQGRDMSREQFDQKYPDPSYGPAIKDTQYAAQVVLEAAQKRAEKAIRYVNRQAAESGFPSLKRVSRKLFSMVVSEQVLDGDDASVNGLKVVTESTPAWLADP